MLDARVEKETVDSRVVHAIYEKYACASIHRWHSLITRNANSSYFVGLIVHDVDFIMVPHIVHVAERNYVIVSFAAAAMFNPIGNFRSITL